MGPSSSLIIIPPVSSAVFQLFLIKTSGDSGLRCKIIMVRQATSKGYFMSRKSVSDEAKAVVRRSIEEVQGKGRFDVFEELFAHDFVDHTTQPGTTPDKAGVRYLYTYMRQAFPDFHAEIHWQLVDGD